MLGPTRCAVVIPTLLGRMEVPVDGLRAEMETAFGHRGLGGPPTQDGNDCVCAIDARCLLPACSFPAVPGTRYSVPTAA